MIAIRFDQVAFKYLIDPVFESLSWDVHSDRVVGLIGANGSGKSTILALIQGRLKPESGFIHLASGATIGVMKQTPELDEANTVLDEVMLAAESLRSITAELHAVEAQLGDPAVYSNEKKLARALARQEELLEEYTAGGGPGFEGSARATLAQLGFPENQLGQRVGDLSGGQKKLVALAKLILLDPSILLLDEPDNHLDLDGKALLEKFIRNYKGAVILVSHDRFLLDMVVDEIAEVEAGRITVYTGNYSEYTVEKEARLAAQQHQFISQQKEITRLEASARRLLLWGRLYDSKKFHNRGVNILKRIERMDKVDKPITDKRQMDLALTGWRGSNKVLEIANLARSFGDLHVLKNINLELRHGQRVGLIGPNGAGKSLLFNLILGQETPDRGEIQLGPSIEVGYYAQQHETLDFDRSLIETIRYATPVSEQGAVAFLQKFLFTYEQCRSPVRTLSGGERSRLQMALLMLSKANFLLLDEPTNNLDIASAEVLENALSEFNGSLLIISHDRYFLDAMVDHIYELEDGRLTHYLGGYVDYVQEKNHIEKQLG
jgi:ATP-binding cassette subfamily F protein 3